jgi:hypothetical protein
MKVREVIAAFQKEDPEMELVVSGIGYDAVVGFTHTDVIRVVKDGVVEYKWHYFERDPMPFEGERVTVIEPLIKL